MGVAGMSRNGGTNGKGRKGRMGEGGLMESGIVARKTAAPYAPPCPTRLRPGYVWLRELRSHY